jgi:hypothetical protein
VAGKKSTATLAKNMTFCLPRQQNWVNKKKTKLQGNNLKKRKIESCLPVAQPPISYKKNNVIEIQSQMY